VLLELELTSSIREAGHSPKPRILIHRARGQAVKPYAEAGQPQTGPSTLPAFDVHSGGATARPAVGPVCRECVTRERPDV